MITQQIRLRNWQKARLMGFCVDQSVLTNKEKNLIGAMLLAKNVILSDWDKSTEELIGHPLPPYKCKSCGKRSNVAYELEGDNYCSKHFKAFSDG